MDNILEKIKEINRESTRITQDSRTIRNSDNYTTIQKKEYEIHFEKRKKEISKEKLLFKNKIIETTCEVYDVEEETKNKWEITLHKKFSDKLFDSIFFYLKYNMKDENLNEIIFKLSKGDFVITKFEITSYGEDWVNGNMISIQKTTNKKCYIATVCYDSFDSKEVILFRRFRDESLSKFILGRGFILLYYTLSPNLSKIIGKSSLLKYLIKHLILFPIYTLIRFFKIV